MILTPVRMVGPAHQLERIFNATAMWDSQAQHVNLVKFVVTVTPWPWSSQLIRTSQLFFRYFDEFVQRIFRSK